MTARTDKARRRAGRRVSIRDVAKAVGYSATVVSHALNDYARINRETRERIQRVAREMGYAPNAAARSLVTRRSMLIGMVVPGIITSFYPEIIEPLKQHLRERGYGLLVMTSDDVPEGERQALEFLRQRQVDGMIVAPCSGARDAAGLDELAAAGTPVVMIDRWLPSAECHSVATDNVAGSEAATRHLLELGHRRIGIVRAPLACSSTRERMAGYRNALRAFGVSYDAARVKSPAYRIGRDQYVDGGEVLRAFLALRSPPTALVVFHDPMAVGVLSAAMKLGLKVPQDLSIVGYDDLEIVKHLPVPLTTVAQDKGGMARAAADLILASLGGGGRPRKQDVRLAPRLVVRESTCPPRQPEAKDKRKRGKVSGVSRRP